MRTLLFSLICLLPVMGFGQFTPFKFENFSKEADQLDVTEKIAAKDSIALNDFERFYIGLQKTEIDAINKRFNSESKWDKRRKSNGIKKLDAKYKNVYYRNSIFAKYQYDVKLSIINNHYDSLRQKKLLQTTESSDDIDENITSLDKIEVKQKSAQVEAEKLLELSHRYNYHYRMSDLCAVAPVLNSTAAQLFYNNTIDRQKAQFGESTTFVYNTQANRISGMNELYADYFGGVRVSFGALISNQSQKIIADSLGNPIIDSAGIQIDAVQRLLGGGGNGILSASWPMLYFKGPLNHFGLKMMLSPKLSFDIPALGKTTTGPTCNTDIGIDVATYYAGAANVMTFYAFNRISYISGTSNFYNNLDIDSRKPFLLNQFTLGIAFNSRFKVSYTLYAGNSFVKDNFQSMVSFSVITD